jgi:hypothetical protein
MKNLFLATGFLILIVGCTNNSNKKAELSELTDIERIAKAYGIDKFNEIKKLHYTFNVARDTLVVSRSWIWNKESGEITMISNQDTVSYFQDDITEDVKKIDRRFINDKYWLLFPFQLVWDTDMTYENFGSQIAPVSGKQLTKLTIQYGADGGYTPGDAYDLYLDETWIIREWEFRRSGKEPPGSTITWEGYSDFNGIKVATNHLRKEGNFSLYFSDVKFE